MTTMLKELPYTPQTLVQGQISHGNPLSFRVEVPIDAIPGKVGSVSVTPFGDAQVKVEHIGIAADDTTFPGGGTNSGGTFYFQIASDPPNPAKPGSVYPYQVRAGDALFVNMTTGDGGSGWPAPKTMAAECRAAG